MTYFEPHVRYQIYSDSQTAEKKKLMKHQLRPYHCIQERGLSTEVVQLLKRDHWPRMPRDGCGSFHTFETSTKKKSWEYFIALSYDLP